MLEEKTDNLLDADGDKNMTSQETVQTENTVEQTVTESIPDTEVEAPIVAETNEAPEVEDLVGEEIAESKIATETNPEVEVETSNINDSHIIELTPDELANDELEYEHGTNDIINAIANVNAAESEDETVRHEIPLQDYETLSMEALVAELETLVTNEKVMAVKDHVEEIKKAFLAKYHHFIEEKKDEFHAENPDTSEDFHYHFPLKVKFDQLYSKYRDRKNNHFKSLQTNLKSNLEIRLAIVEELRNLINPQENIKDTLKHFNELRDRWKNAGPIPKDKYNHVWNNYHFHVENFYDYLHLDREARDIDFKHNLDQKLKIIARVEELVNEADINKAFRELQDLHKIWKEDIGPVSREHREEVWNKFSDLTKQMHDKREVLFEKLRGTELENLNTKKDIIAKIEVLAQEKVNSHAAWLGQVEKVEALRNEFFIAGKVPSDLNEETWASFKNAVRSFNVLKNSFYKDIKKDQNDNLTKKQALVAKAKELQESTDFETTTPIMKQIQEDWKQIGHVPRKYSDKLWAEFRGACNGYFEKLKEQKSEENAVEVEAFDKKKDYLETIKTFELIGEHKADLAAIKLHIEAWKSFGKVPFQRRHIEGKFNKILDALFEKLSLSKKDTDMMRFANRMDHLSENNDTRKLDNEKIFLMRKIEEVQNEIFQLENNIQFFTNTRNAKKENSIVLEVRKNIAIHKESLDVWKEKLKQLRNLKQE
ncbi:DUF349 domain-containing protein [Flavobacterium luteum]|uniref:DUF349 domain-containing protein n=1 Tax=Flavobacterium luteum TaxID=2026654 RepID=A0A7J5AAY1_9FLAO|nr:DUF349 domain-containing protein [Flavobacterium luteum]KAB1154741.1 DUF349 domain-containing protein [Flavobacterium luteum]